jgi:hypothetical protein
MGDDCDESRAGAAARLSAPWTLKPPSMTVILIESIQNHAKS